MAVEDDQSMIVLVTGGAGYIGSHACKALASAGFVPVVYDNLSRGHSSAVQWGPFEVGDIGDSARLEEVLNKYRPVAVMHFAALAYVGESMVDPASYYQNNTRGSLQLLDALRRYGIRNIVFSSTCATYGVPSRVPISEQDLQAPVNPYGASKLMVERMIKDFAAAYDMRYMILRYFNAAGADAEGDIGEDHTPETHLIPLAVEAALGKRESLTIMGNDYPTRDGTCIRDYIHVTDLAEAHVIALKKLLAEGKSHEVNLGTGCGFSVREIIGKVGEITGTPVPVVHGQRRPGDPPELVADVTMMKSLFNWQPVCSDIDTIIHSAVKWHSKQ